MRMGSVSHSLLPARTAIGVAALPLGGCVEIDLVVKV